MFIVSQIWCYCDCVSTYYLCAIGLHNQCCIINIDTAVKPDEISLQAIREAADADAAAAATAALGQDSIYYLYFVQSEVVKYTSMKGRAAKNKWRQALALKCEICEHLGLSLSPVEWPPGPES